MAIQSGGPPRPPPGALRPQPLRSGPTGAKKTVERSGAEHTSASDAFEEGHRGEGATARPRAPVAGGRSPALVQQSLDRLEREIREKQAEVARLIAVIAREGFAKEAAARHKKTLAALRKKLADAHGRASKARRALAEIERGTGRVASSRLGRIDAELAAIESETDDGKRALAALLLAAEIAAEEPVRRLAVRSADKARALAYAELDSPTVMLTDVAAAAAEEIVARREGARGATAKGDAEGPPPAPSSTDDAGALGKSLAGQERLGALVRGRGKKAGAR